MPILDRAKQLDDLIRERLGTIQLIGELVGLAEFKDVGSTVADLYGLGADPCVAAPHLLSFAVVAIANQLSDGKELWPFVDAQLTRFAAAAAPPLKLHTQIGDTFERVLDEAGLPTFKHLVEQGAHRFVAPMLAHAIIPLKLVPALLDKVIQPILDEGSLVGLSVQDLRRQFDKVNSGIPVTVSRFLFDGGRVTQDLLERITLYVANGCDDPTSFGLPFWLWQAIDLWRRNAGTSLPITLQGRLAVLPSPTLRYDPFDGALRLELPYLDEPGDRWLIANDDNPVRSLEAYEPLWRRDGPRRVVQIEAPYRLLRVDLTGADGATRRSWTLPAIPPNRPVVAFAWPGAAALTNQNALHGARWYLLRPTGSASCQPVGAGSVRVVSGLGSPAGWAGWSVEEVEAQSVEEFQVAGVTFRVASGTSAAIIERSAALPDYLVPLDADMLSMTRRSATIRLPGAGTQVGSIARPRVWEIQCRGGAGQLVPRTSLQLTGKSVGPDLIVSLDELLPGSTGTWDLSVRGRMGEGASARVAFLPEDWDVKEPPTVPAFVGDVRTLEVHTSHTISVLAEPGGRSGDTAERDALGRWLLRDGSAKGRITVEVTDPMGGGSVRILVKLPTVRWRWLVRGIEHKWMERAAILAPDLSGAAIQIRSDLPLHLALDMCDSSGRMVQQAWSGNPTTTWNVALGQFSTTAPALDGAATFRLRVIPPGAVLPLLEAGIGAMVRPAGVSNLSASARQPGEFVFEWQQENRVPVTAKLFDEYRPWDDAGEEDVEGTGRRRQVSIYLPPGGYRLELWSDDGWSGPVRIHNRHVSVGTAAEQGAHRRGLPADVKGLLQRAIAESSGKASCLHLRNIQGLLAQPPGRAEKVEPLSRLMEVLAAVVANGVMKPVAEVPWWDLADWLAPRTDFRAEPLINAVASTMRTPELQSFLHGLRLGRWRALWHARKNVRAQTRTQLWATWPPLAAFLDLDDPDPEAVSRCEFYLRVDPVGRRGAVRWVDFLDTKTPGSPANSAWAQDSAAAQPPWTPEPTQQDPLKRVAGDVFRYLNWSPEEIRRPMNVAFTDDLPSVSILLACWERLIARGVASNAEAHPPASFCARVSQLVPNLYAHDLCIAEAMMVGVYGRR